MHSFAKFLELYNIDRRRRDPTEIAAGFLWYHCHATGGQFADVPTILQYYQAAATQPPTADAVRDSFRAKNSAVVEVADGQFRVSQPAAKWFEKWEAPVFEMGLPLFVVGQDGEHKVAVAPGPLAFNVGGLPLPARPSIGGYPRRFAQDLGGGSMIERRIFISSVSSLSTDDPREAFRIALLTRIRDAGYTPQQFNQSGLPLNMEWSFENVDAVMRKCVGAVVMGFAEGVHVRGELGFKHIDGTRHYEGAVAVSLGLPLLRLKDSNVVDGGVLAGGDRTPVTNIPNNVDDAQFIQRFTGWLKEIEARRDIFLGFCSKSRSVAAEVQNYLQKHGATVKNWEMDFRTGQSILSEIEAARASCSAGVFLFSEDDVYNDVEGLAAPRDNVIFEAGYFMSAKGPDRSLIVRVGKAKMPADLGGAIYVDLDKGASVATIEGRLIDFLKKNL